MSTKGDPLLERRSTRPLMIAKRAGCRALLALLSCATLMAGAITTSAESGDQTLFRTTEVGPMQSSTTGPALPVVIISDLTAYADDNIAILMLLRSGKADVRGVITTNGNVCAHRAAEEARRFLEAAGAPAIPVVRGFPLAWHQDRLRFFQEVQKPLRPADAYAGALGSDASCNEDLGEVGSGTDAADFLIEQARAAKGGLTVVLIGPATVLAEAMRRDRRLPDFVREVLAMGGAIRSAGNVTPHAEFNVWFDPEAMASVLASRIPVTLVPLDATEAVTYAQLPLSEKLAGGFAGSYLAAYLEKAGRRRNPVPMWDEVLAAVVIDPTLIERVEDTYLTVSTKRDEHYGEILSSSTATDSAPRPVRVVTKVSADGVRQLITQLLALP